MAELFGRSLGWPALFEGWRVQPGGIGLGKQMATHNVPEHSKLALYIYIYIYYMYIIYITLYYIILDYIILYFIILCYDIFHYII